MQYCGQYIVDPAFPRLIRTVSGGAGRQTLRDSPDRQRYRRRFTTGSTNAGLIVLWLLQDYRLDLIVINAQPRGSTPIWVARVWLCNHRLPGDFTVPDQVPNVLI
jgi:hypothetical protein